MSAKHMHGTTLFVVIPTDNYLCNGIRLRNHCNILVDTDIHSKNGWKMHHARSPINYISKLKNGSFDIDVIDIAIDVAECALPGKVMQG